jgi:putative ABC transport system ATP-binding protein
VSLELHEVVKHYRKGDLARTADGVLVPIPPVRAVDGVSLKIARGEFIALYGPSGSGKTTLLEIVASLLTPDKGSVLFNGRDISRLKEGQKALYRRRDIGLIPQSVSLVAGSALTNAAFKLHADGFSMREGKEAARPWLERVGLAGRLEHRPDELSMGERQRVAIARALVNEPGLLLADEPTGSLDSERTRDVLQLLREVSHERNIPALIVTHDYVASAFVDRAFTLTDGKLHDGLEVEAAPTSLT